MENFKKLKEAYSEVKLDEAKGDPLKLLDDASMNLLKAQKIIKDPGLKRRLDDIIRDIDDVADDI